ncbi:helix-turn-helix domain-containing protein [Candidatus Oleimmundimicrobium sp.]|uniref:PucR family transcriptional regulator n=1 Tax=Candidatus Oleimmundimicrobium sp. TaxID=3060597 RepID=UPI002728713F|nr:helix-turn-helix domain-containing protein [Candidatus Oleimmundimicrobium sp.]MDO8886328.1 helix-turn-helix domain-containing protein [Candidatus Oleimmundimicrobium sp.]
MEKLDKEKLRGQRRSHEESLAHDLIMATDETDLVSLQIRSRFLDFDLSKPLTAIIIDWAQPEEEQNFPQDEEKLLELLHSFFEVSTHLAAMAGSTKSMILKTLQMADAPIIALKKKGPLQENHHIGNLCELGQALHQYIYEKLKQDVVIGLGNYYEGSFSAKKSFREATLALELGKNFDRESRVFHISNYFLTNLLSSVQRPYRKDFLWGTLKPLQNEEELIKTIEIFFETNMNISLTAKKLFAHRNTLIYRLNKVRNLTGLDPKNFHDAIRLYVALKLYYLEQAQVFMD